MLSSVLGLFAFAVALMEHPKPVSGLPTLFGLAVVSSLTFFAELRPVRIQYGGLSIANSWSEVSLVVGLFVLQPTTHIAVCATMTAVAALINSPKSGSKHSWKPAFNSTLGAAKLALLVLITEAFGPIEVGASTGAAILFGVVIMEACATPVLLCIFRILRQNPGTKEMVRGTVFGISFSLLLTAGSFGLVGVALSNLGLMWFLLVIPAALIALSPYVGRLIEDKNQWTRHGRFIRTVDDPESTLEEMMALMRTQLAVRRVDLGIRFDPVGDELARVWFDETGFHQFSLADGVRSDPMWLAHSEGKQGEVRQFGDNIAVPTWLSGVNDSLVVTVGTTDVVSVWAASGRTETKRKNFQASLHEPFASMCWGVVNALDARRRLEEVQRRATHDSVTGLANRERFHTLLETEIENVRASGGGVVGVMMLDLDAFKTVNDSWGHTVGDQYLKHVARGMLAVLPEGCHLARFAGDEFAAIIPAEAILDVESTSIAISGAIGEIFYPDRHSTYRGTASVGYAIYPLDVAGSVDSADCSGLLLRHADAAMHSAKRTKQTHALRFDVNRDEQNEQNDQLAADITNALASNQLRIHLQPIFVADSLLPNRRREVASFEALARIEHPAGMIMPSDFIRIAERTKQIHAVTERVLDLACAQLAEWSRFDIAIAINLSMANLLDFEIVSKIDTCLKQYNVTPRRLIVEVTESMMMLDGIDAIGVIQRIRDLGVRISMDDFGTGYSSLARLTELPIDELKVDRQFLVDATRFVADYDIEGRNSVERSRIVLETMITLARKLGIPTTVEGIERPDGLKLVQDLGATKVQGYIASRPLKPIDATALLETTRKPRSRTETSVIPIRRSAASY